MTNWSVIKSFVSNMFFLLGAKILFCAHVTFRWRERERREKERERERERREKEREKENGEKCCQDLQAEKNKGLHIVAKKIFV